ncbi:MAG: type II toxin-antitoxin system HicA family toxin [Bacteroidetes bacterium]|nr:type II toxin-antitoxin system HicA family toxin [Bacteroidota bacterium]
MKRSFFLKHLHKHHCVLAREGSKHSIYKNAGNGKATSVPRHPDLNDITCRLICKQLDIPFVK